jgi:alpha-1,2-mannosyltransferase
MNASYPLKILFIHPRLGVLGGAERVLIHMLRALQENELSLMTDSLDTEAVKKMYGVELSEVKWIQCPSFRSSSQHFVAFQWLRYTKKINHLIREVCGHYDLLIETQQVYSDPCSGTRLISYIHYPDLAVPPPEGNVTSSIYYALLRPLILRRVKKIKLVLTNSPFTARIIAEYLKIKPVVLYPPVDFKRFYSDRNWSDREDKVVNIGMFLPFKRQHLLLEVARQLPTVQFVIIGTISADHQGYYEKLNIQRPDNVTMIPNASLDQVREQLASAKAYVHLCPEHFGISVVEAASAGCVPIVYYVGGPAENFDDASLRWKDLKQLSTFIHETIKNENLWSELSEKAKKKSLEFDSSIFETRIRDIVKEQFGKYE